MRVSSPSSCSLPSTFGLSRRLKSQRQPKVLISLERTTASHRRTINNIPSSIVCYKNKMLKSIVLVAVFAVAATRKFTCLVRYIQLNPTNQLCPVCNFNSHFQSHLILALLHDLVIQLSLSTPSQETAYDV